MYECASNFRKTLNGCLPLQNSSDFDEKVLEMIALTSSVVLAILRINEIFFVFRLVGGGVGGGAAGRGWVGWALRSKI